MRTIYVLHACACLSFLLLSATADKLPCEQRETIVLNFYRPFVKGGAAPQKEMLEPICPKQNVQDLRKLVYDKKLKNAVSASDKDTLYCKVMNLNSKTLKEIGMVDGDFITVRQADAVQ